MIKRTALNMLVRSDVFSVFRHLNREKLPVLMYHRFSEREEFGKTSRKTFETHLEYLTRKYDIIPLRDAVKHLADGGRLPERAAVLTIDDGYRDFYEIAFPALQRYRVCATLYIVTGFVDKQCWIWTDRARFLLTETTAKMISFKIGAKQFDEPLGDRDARLALAGKVNSELKRLPDTEKERVLRELSVSLDVIEPEIPPAEFGPISWDQAREMAAGGIEIGSHTVKHPILTNVSSGVLEDELTASLKTIQKQLQKEDVHFCYPNGNVSQRERDAVERAGYASAVTTEIRLCEQGDDRFLIPRIDAEPDTARLIQSTSGFDAFKARFR